MWGFLLEGRREKPVDENNWLKQRCGITILELKRDRIRERELRSSTLLKSNTSIKLMMTEQQQQQLK